VGTVAVVALDVAAEHLRKGFWPGDQQPVQALGPHVRIQRSAEALALALGLYRRDQYLGAVRTEDIVEDAGELRLPIANKEAHSSAPLAQHKAQVAGLLGNPGPIRVGGHGGQVDPPGPQLDEAQHLQAPQPHRVDDEEIRRRSRWPAGAGTPARLSSSAQQDLRLTRNRTSEIEATATDGSERRSVGGLQPGSSHLAAQHRELVWRRTRISRSLSPGPLIARSTSPTRPLPPSANSP
jgi:hypothetical protein